MSGLGFVLRVLGLVFAALGFGLMVCGFRFQV